MTRMQFMIRPICRYIHSMKYHKILLFSAILISTNPGYAVTLQEVQAPQAKGGSIDTPTDPEDLDSIQRAAGTGDTRAQYLLGMAYFQGTMTARNYEEAEKWFRKAAEKGDPSAQYMLGKMYVEGLGLAQDYTKAFMWLTMSIAGSDETQSRLIKEAYDLRNSFIGKMTRQQLAEAAWLADQGTNKPDKESEIYLFGSNISNPVGIIRPNPAYTEKARNARVEGIVVLQCIIRKTGNVDRCKIIRGLGYGLNESAIRTIESEWLFQPGTREGIPVDVLADFEIGFKIF